MEELSLGNQQRVQLAARADVPAATAISEYVDVAKAFYDARESGFVNGLLDALAKEVRR